jgi:hypothetical protein
MREEDSPAIRGTGGCLCGSVRYEVRGPLRPVVDCHRSSSTARRGFCGDCGSSLFWEPASGERISIAAGTLDLPTGLETVAHVFVEDSGDYYTISDDLPRRADGNHGIVIPAD